MKIIQKLFYAFATIIALASCSKNDPSVVLPTISIEDVTADEGSPLVFTVSVNTASKDTITFRYKTEDITTTSDDFIPIPVALTAQIKPGHTSVRIGVNTSSDHASERSETLKVILSDAKNAVISGGEGIGTIINVASLPAPTYFMKVKIDGMQWDSQIGDFFGAEFIHNTFAGYGTDYDSQLSFIFENTPSGPKTYSIEPLGPTNDDNLGVYYSPTFFTSGIFGQTWNGQAKDGEFKITSYDTKTMVAEGTFKFSTKGETDGKIHKFTEGSFKVHISN